MLEMLEKGMAGVCVHKTGQISGSGWGGRGQGPLWPVPVRPHSGDRGQRGRGASVMLQGLVMLVPHPGKGLPGAPPPRARAGPARGPGLSPSAATVVAMADMGLGSRRGPTAAPHRPWRVLSLSPPCLGSSLGWGGDRREAEPWSPGCSPATSAPPRPPLTSQCGRPPEAPFLGVPCGERGFGSCDISRTGRSPAGAGGMCHPACPVSWVFVPSTTPGSGLGPPCCLLPFPVLRLPPAERGAGARRVGGRGGEAWRAITPPSSRRSAYLSRPSRAPAPASSPHAGRVRGRSSLVLW